MVKNVNYFNPIHQEENTPLVTIFELKLDSKKALAKDSRGASYVIDLSKSSFGGIRYPKVGSQWYVKKISSVWTLMSRAPQQNPELDPSLTPAPGETYIGGEGTTYIVGDLQVTGGLTVIGAGTDLEVGAIKIFTTDTPPTGWLICDGSAISRTTYSQLFGVIGTTFGVGDGSTTFNIPNIKGRIPIGKDAAQTEFDVMGETGGSKTKTLTTTELPAHTHAVGTLANAAEAAHTHGAGTYGAASGGTHQHEIGVDNSPSGGSGIFTINSPGSSAGDAGSIIGTFADGSHSHSVTGTSAAGSSHNHSISGSTASSGTGSAFANMPPYIVLNFIIKALPSSGAGGGGGATNLDGLTDVVISSPLNNQVLKFNGAQWVNATVSTGGATNLDGLTDVVITSPASTQVVQYNGVSWVNAILSESDITNLTSDLAAKQNLSTVTTKGDLYAATASATTTRLGVGTNGQVLYADSTQATGIKWATLAESDITNLVSDLAAKLNKSVLTAKGDIYVATGSGVVVNQPIGSDTQVLTADSAQTNGLKWAAVPSDPSKVDKSTLTTKGDIYVATGASTVVRLGVGTDSQVLTANSGTGTGLSWVTPSGGAVSVFNDLTDVTITSVADKNIVQYDSGTSQWVNRDSTALGIPGEIKLWPAKVAPSTWQICDGTSLTRTTYPNTFAAVVPALGAATMTIASPCVVTLTSHGLIAGDKIMFTTTGALPTGVSANTLYFVLSTSITANTFRFSTTDGGAAVNSSGTQSGVHTLYHAPYGFASSTTFNVPDLRGRVPVGRDTTQVEFDVLSDAGGAKTHTLQSTEMPSHTHTQNAHNHTITDPTHAHGENVTADVVAGSGIRTDYNTDASSASFSQGITTDAASTGVTINNTTATNQNTGGGGAHNNLQPYAVVNYIIKLG
ncbi:MAG TPA: tail fiber protein [Candidatus Paceibacterota bacterium]